MGNKKELNMCNVINLWISHGQHCTFACSLVFMVHSEPLWYVRWRQGNEKVILVDIHNILLIKGGDVLGTKRSSWKQQNCIHSLFLLSTNTCSRTPLTHFLTWLYFSLLQHLFKKSWRETCTKDTRTIITACQIGRNNTRLRCTSI